MSPDNAVALEHSDRHMVGVHDPVLCEGRPCALHNRSAHHLRHLPQIWRADRHIIERVCEHGVGHPDPDSPWDDDDANWIHGCDGCCAP